MLTTDGSIVLTALLMSPPVEATGAGEVLAVELPDDEELPSIAATIPPPATPASTAVRLSATTPAPSRRARWGRGDAWGVSNTAAAGGMATGGGGGAIGGSSEGGGTVGVPDGPAPIGPPTPGKSGCWSDMASSCRHGVCKRRASASAVRLRALCVCKHCRDLVCAGAEA